MSYSAFTPALALATGFINGDHLPDVKTRAETFLDAVQEWLHLGRLRRALGPILGWFRHLQLRVVGKHEVPDR